MLDRSTATPVPDPTTLGLQLFEASPDCVKLLDASCRIVAMNRNGMRAMEVGELGQVLGSVWAALWPEASHADLDAAIGAARSTGSGRFRGACPTAAGTLKWWDVTVSAVGAPSGGLLAVSRDITAQVQADAERERLVRQLSVANDRMQAVFRQTPAFMCVLAGPDHVFELVNERYLQHIGNRSPLGLPLREALPEIAGQGFIELLDRVYRTGEPFEGTDLPVMLRRRPDAPLERRFVDLVYLALRDDEGSITGVMAHGIDQTERKLVELALYESRERFEKIVSQAATGVVQTDTEGRITLANQRYCAMVARSEAELLGTSVFDLTAADSVPVTEAAIRRLAAGEAGVVVDKEYLRSDGTLMPATSSVNALRGPGGEFQGLVAIVIDTTESKKSEATLRKLASDLAEADRRKTEFLATLAHELRNPLAPIRSGLGVMRLRGDDAATVARVREVMERQVGHMVHLIDDLLDIARISGGKLELKKERADLRQVLSSAVETSLPLVEAGQHALSVEVPDAPVAAEVDVTRIAQVVANLLNNAAKYTPAGGRIGLSLRVEGREAVIAVADNGIGIPEASLALVFEMFSQLGHHLERAQGGLGIGLSLVRRLVDMHGGTVSAASGAAQAGSVFTVRLPLAGASAGMPAPADAAEAEHEGEGDAVAAGSTRILVVDDNVDAATTLSMILEACGYATQVAHDGAQAVAAARAFRPQVAFLDIGMPGMDGYDTARAMRRVAGLEGMTLVALTGWGAESDRRKSNEAGFDHHLTKPVQLDVVQALLATLPA